MSAPRTATADLVVDGRLLDESERSLKTIRTALEQCPASMDDLAHAVGTGRMADVMHTFADNWKDNRKETLWNLDQVLGMVHDTRAAFEDVDGDLATRARSHAARSTT